MKTRIHQAIELITEEIIVTLEKQRSEENAPSHGADQSDDIIKSCAEKATALRRLRDELEMIPGSGPGGW